MIAAAHNAGTDANDSAGKVGATSVKKPDWVVASDCKETEELLNNTDENELKWTCIPCPEGASCQQYSTVASNTILPKFGWSKCNADKDTIPFDKCLFSGACLGAKNTNLIGRFNASIQNGSLPNHMFKNSEHGKKEYAKLKDLLKKNNYEQDPALWCSDLVGSVKKDINKTCIVGCAIGYKKNSRLCSECDSGYSHGDTSLTGECKICPPNDQNVIIAATSVVGAIIGLIILVKIT